MPDDQTEILAALQEIKEGQSEMRGEVHVMSANVDAMGNELKNHSALLIQHQAEINELKSGVRVAPIDQLAARPFPRAPMATLDEVGVMTADQPRAMTSIRAAETEARKAEAEARKGVRENRLMTVLVCVFVPLMVALINNCGHH